MNNSEVPVFIMAGGLGARIKQETQLRPKPMLPIGEHPILWHINEKIQPSWIKKFVVCAGFKAEVIKSYFLNYDWMNSDFTVNLKTHKLQIHSTDHEEDWEVQSPTQVST